MNWVHRNRKVASGRKVGAIRSLVNAIGLEFECARVLHEALLVPLLLNDSETDMERKEMSGIRGVQMDNLRTLLGIKRMDRVPNMWIREFCNCKRGG